MYDSVLKEILNKFDSIHEKLDSVNTKLESHISEHQAQSRVWRTIVAVMSTLIAGGGLLIACIK